MYRAEFITHRGVVRIAVYFKNDAQLIARFKLLKGAAWSASLKLWHLPNTNEYRNKFKLDSKRNELKLHAASIDKFSIWMRSKRYSENTIKTYIDSLRTFLTFFKNKESTLIDNDDVMLFNHE